jgi:hypothetical protein
MMRYGQIIMAMGHLGTMIKLMVPKRVMDEITSHVNITKAKVDKRRELKTDRSDFMTAILAHVGKAGGISLDELYATPRLSSWRAHDPRPPKDPPSFHAFSPLIHTSPSYSYLLSSSETHMAKMTHSNNEAHAKLIAELQGQVMHVPDMLAMFKDWHRFGQNKYYTRVKSELDEVLARFVPSKACAENSGARADHLHSSAFTDEKRRKRAEKSDFALFVSMYKRSTLMPPVACAVANPRGQAGIQTLAGNCSRSWVCLRFGFSFPRRRCHGRE